MLGDNDQLEVLRVKSANEVAAISKRCARDHKRYTDELFPPAEAVWYAPEEPHDEAQSTGMSAPERWARLSEFVARPVLWPDEGPDPRSLMQGNVGTRYLIDSAALVAAVFPEALRGLFLKHDAAVGVYTVAFWMNSQWRVVVIDEQVGVNTHPVIGSYCSFAECRKRRQIWLPLLEKAYAKMHRYYEHIHGGVPANALIDITGGATNVVDLSNQLDNCLAWLHPYKALVGEHGAMFHFAFRAGAVAGGGVIGEGVDRMEYSITGTYDIKGYIKFTAVPTNINTKEGFTWQFIGICNSDTKEMHGDTWPSDNPDGSIKWNAQLMRISPLDESDPWHALNSLWPTMRRLADKGKQVVTVAAEEGSKQAISAGLVPGRRYLVMGAFELPDGPTVIKLRDMVGTPEWSGDYAEQSPCWTPDNLNVWLENYDEGVFFLSQMDFTKHFRSMQVCSIPARNWMVQSCTGPWKDLRGPERWMYNPRFRFVLRDPGEAVVSFTISQPNTKLYEGYDHYLVGIGFYILLEISTNPPAKQPAAARSAAASALQGAIVVGHVPAKKVREVSTLMRLYKLDASGGIPPAGGSGVYYVVPYCDSDGMDLPVFFTAHCDKRFHSDFLKGFTSVLLPMPTKSEAYSDEFEKWYWEVRDKWDGVNAVLSRGMTGASTKIFEGVEGSADAPKPITAAESTRSLKDGLGARPLSKSSDENNSDSIAAPLQEQTHVDTMFKRYSVGNIRPGSGRQQQQKLAKSSDATVSPLSAEAEMGTAPQPLRGGKTATVTPAQGQLPTAVSTQQEAPDSQPPGHIVGGSHAKLPALKPLSVKIPKSEDIAGVMPQPVPAASKRLSAILQAPPVQEQKFPPIEGSVGPNATGGWMTPKTPKSVKALPKEVETLRSPNSPSRPRASSEPPPPPGMSSSSQGNNGLGSPVGSMQAGHDRPGSPGPKESARKGSASGLRAHSRAGSATSHKSGRAPSASPQRTNADGSKVCIVM